MKTSGHLYIIQGDIKKIACDAWLLPTSQNYSITSSFQDAVGMESTQGPRKLESWRRSGRHSRVIPTL